MTVAEMRRTMPAREFMEWGIYFGVLAQERQIGR